MAKPIAEETIGGISFRLESRELYDDEREMTFTVFVIIVHNTIICSEKFIADGRATFSKIVYATRLLEIAKKCQ